MNRLQQVETIPHFSCTQGLIYRKGRLIVGNMEGIYYNIIQLFHASSLGGHSGIAVTIKRIARLFWWKTLRKDIRNYVRMCTICQRYKADLSAPGGLLQPLPIPGIVWTDVSLDFIEGLPKSRGKDTILVVVDRLSTYAHFMALAHPFTATMVAQLYFDHIFKLHGVPKTLVSDRDKVFLSQFWQELFRLQHVSLHISTAYHPQSDGQSAVVNKSLEGYLRCMIRENTTRVGTLASLS